MSKQATRYRKVVPTRGELRAVINVRELAREVRTVPVRLTLDY